MEPPADPLMKEMLDLAGELVKTAGPAVAAIVVVLIVLIVGLKWSGVLATVGSKKTLIDDGQISAVTQGIASIAEKADGSEARISHVEIDVQHRATREEMHKLELAFTRMEGRFESIDQRTAATAHGVQRIESFMYEAAMRAKDGK